MTTSPVGQPLTSRTLVRGTSATFEVVFAEPDGTPLVPEDLSNYPAVSITDSSGTIIESGVAVSLGDGRWRYQSLIPVDAQLSTDSDPWRIDWLLAAVGGRQVQLGQNFAVIDSFALTPTDRAYTSLVMLGMSDRLMVKYRSPQSDIQLNLMDQNGCIYSATSQIETAFVDGWYAYYWNSPVWTQEGQYLATWSSRANLLSPPQTLVQVIRVPPIAFWHLQPSLRMVIDKVQKKAGHVQSYSDSDMWEYIQRGSDVINSTGPIITNWPFPIIAGTPVLQSYLVAAAAWWGLQAQFIGEVDIGSWSSSGQTVSLDVDRTGGYDSAISKLNDYITNQLPTTKKGLLRQGSVGSAAVRPISYRERWPARMNGGGMRGNNVGSESVTIPLLGPLGLLG